MAQDVLSKETIWYAGTHNAGIAQLVEHDLAKVGVASSNLVSRSRLLQILMAGWQSGYAADCNSVYAGSIPTPASIFSYFITFQRFRAACDFECLFWFSESIKNKR